MIKKILIVEDTVESACHTCQLVRSCGYTPVVVGSLTAMLALKETRFDLIFLDLLLPETTHATLDVSVRETRHRFKDIPIVVLSCYLPEVNVFKLINLGADMCLYKPLNKDTVKSVIAEAKAIHRGELGLCLSTLDNAIAGAVNDTQDIRLTDAWLEAACL